MAVNEYILDHDARAVSRVVSQFKDSAEVAGTLRVLASQVQEIENAIFFLPYFMRDLNFAGSDALSRIGKLVGAPQRGPLDDTGYLQRIRAQVLSNNSDGTSKNLLDIVNAIHPVNKSGNDQWVIYEAPLTSARVPWLSYSFKGDVEIRQLKDGAFDTDAGFPPFIAVFFEREAREIIRYIKDAAAGGVHCILHYRPDATAIDGIFRCATDAAPGGSVENAAGLGSGKLMGCVDRP